MHGFWHEFSSSHARTPARAGGGPRPAKARTHESVSQPCLYNAIACNGQGRLHQGGQAGRLGALLCGTVWHGLAARHPSTSRSAHLHLHRQAPHALQSCQELRLLPRLLLRLAGSRRSVHCKWPLKTPPPPRCAHTDGGRAVCYVLVRVCAPCRAHHPAAVNKFARTATLFLDEFTRIDYRAWTPSIGDGSDFGIPGECCCMPFHTAGWAAVCGCIPLPPPPPPPRPPPHTPMPQSPCVRGHACRRKCTTFRAVYGLHANPDHQPRPRANGRCLWRLAALPARRLGQRRAAVLPEHHRELRHQERGGLL